MKENLKITLTSESEDPDYCFKVDAVLPKQFDLDSLGEGELNKGEWSARLKLINDDTNTNGLGSINIQLQQGNLPLTITVPFVFLIDETNTNCINGNVNNLVHRLVLGSNPSRKVSFKIADFISLEDVVVTGLYVLGAYEFTKSGYPTVVIVDVTMMSKIGV